MGLGAGRLDDRGRRRRRDLDARGGCARRDPARKWIGPSTPRGQSRLRARIRRYYQPRAYRDGGQPRGREAKVRARAHRQDHRDREPFGDTLRSLRRRRCGFGRRRRGCGLRDLRLAKRDYQPLERARRRLVCRQSAENRRGGAQAAFLPATRGALLEVPIEESRLARRDLAVDARGDQSPRVGRDCFDAHRLSSGNSN